MNQSQIDTLTSNIFKNILSQIEIVIHNMKSTFHNEFSNTDLVLSVSIKILYMDCERLNKFDPNTNLDRLYFLSEEVRFLISRRVSTM